MMQISLSGPWIRLAKGTCRRLDVTIGTPTALASSRWKMALNPQLVVIALIPSDTIILASVIIVRRTAGSGFSRMVRTLAPDTRWNLTAYSYDAGFVLLPSRVSSCSRPLGTCPASQHKIPIFAGSGLISIIDSPERAFIFWRGALEPGDSIG